jgi:hypothetical protein
MKVLNLRVYILIKRGFAEEQYNNFSKPQNNFSINDAQRYENIDPYRAYSAGYPNDNYQRQTSSNSLNMQPSSFNNQAGYQPSSYPRNDKLQLLDALDSRLKYYLKFYNNIQTLKYYI